MKKIGILTYHTGYNYGASLQAFALQKTIKKYIDDVETINFEKEEFKASREMFCKKPKRMKEVIKVLTRLPYRKSLLKRQALFDSFTKDCIELSPLYKSEEEVIKNAENYECIVCGSDQIWNLSKKIDAPAANPIFFLNFEKKQKRISYAASFGKWITEAPQNEDIFFKWLKEFDYISVRETSCNDDVIKAAKIISKQMKLPVINIVPPPRAMFSGIKRKLDVGPREFLSLVKNAEFVVTNSFHGTAFSITYEKDFISVVSGKPDPRMESLMSQLGLKDNLTTVDNVELEKLKNINYNDVRNKKKDLRKDSIDYLKRALGV